MDNDFEQKTIVVLGAPRSGTSVVTGILTMCGVNMGNFFLPADRFNPKGYFEDLEIQELNKKILKNVDADIDKPPIDIIKDTKEDIKKELFTILNKKNNNLLWGWKDPRTVFTIDCFIPHLNNPYFVICTRNPCDNAESISEHTGFNFLNQNPLLPSMFVVYDAIMKNPLAIAKKIAKFMSIKIKHDEKIEQMLEEFVISKQKISLIRTRAQRQIELRLRDEIEAIHQSREWKRSEERRVGK